MSEKLVTLYALSTCVYCRSIEKMLAGFTVKFNTILVDELSGPEQENKMAELTRINPRASFPTLVIGDRAIVGFKEQEIKDTLGIRTEVDDLFERLQKVNSNKVYLFNGDRETTFELLRGLITNRERYGYMSCPCRLAASDRHRDKDIICPCDYRRADVEEFGSCFCGLYVTKAWNNHQITRQLVPERRTANS